MTAELDIAWRCSRRGEFYLKSWQDGMVVFNAADGHLQCLSPVYGQVFELLASGQVKSSFELASELLAESAAPEDVELVENALNALASSNLIERVTG